MDDFFIGSIKQFTDISSEANPDDWFACQGQLLSIFNFMPLYSLIKTKYGGDGYSCFKLPDLRVKKSDGSYYKPGEVLPDGSTYIESYICVNGDYPTNNSN